MKRMKFLAAAAAAFALVAFALVGCSSGGGSSSSSSASESGIKSFDDLAGKTVMTQVDSAALAVLEDEEGQAKLAATFGDLQTIGDYNNAFLQLDSGAVDAVACDLSIAEYQIAKNPDKYVMLETPLSEEHYGVGFAIGNEDLAKQVTATLQKLDEQGVVEELCQKYEDAGMTYDNWVLPKADGTADVAISSDVTLTVGFDASYPPYGYIGDDGEYTGFDLDLAKAVCDANGWTFKAEPIDWDAKDALLNSGTINCIWNGFTIEGREGSYAFTEPYMINEQVIVVKK